MKLEKARAGLLCDMSARNRGGAVWVGKIVADVPRTGILLLVKGSVLLVTEYHSHCPTATIPSLFISSTLTTIVFDAKNSRIHLYQPLTFNSCPIYGNATLQAGLRPLLLLPFPLLRGTFYREPPPRRGVGMSNTHQIHQSSQSFDALHANGYHTHRAASRTPNRLPTPLPSIHSSATTDADLGADEDPRISVFTELYLRSEARLEALFDSRNDLELVGSSSNAAKTEGGQENAVPEDAPPDVFPPPKKAARTIDEDDYDDSEGEEEDTPVDASPLKAKSTGLTAIPSLSLAPMVRTLSSTPTAPTSKPVPINTSSKTSEDARKELEQNKKATEDAAKRSFHTLFYTVENDRDAMFDQKKLEESERQVDEEISGLEHAGTSSKSQAAGNAQQGTLSQTNLGALSLTLKHLIARIDKKRNEVAASDVELRSLIGEVKKNRSKWANEDRVGQEELYEAAEKVLNELKAMTEHSTAFLQRVNKREAPDYYNGKAEPRHVFCPQMLISPK